MDPIRSVRNPRLQRVRERPLGARRRAVDPEDRADGDAALDVGGAVEGVEHDDVVAGVGLLHGDGGVLLLGGNHAGAPRLIYKVARIYGKQAQDDIQDVLDKKLYAFVKRGS